MAYRTVMRFSEPERLIVAVDEPGRGRVRHDIRLGGVGEDGPHRFIETEEGPGRAPRRFRLDHIVGATRPDGSAVDVREAILDAQDWTKLGRGEADDQRPGWSLERRVRHWLVGVLIGLGLAGVAVGVGVVTGDAALAQAVFVYGLVAIGVGALAFALPGLLGDMSGIFRRRR